MGRSQEATITISNEKDRVLNIVRPLVSSAPFLPRALPGVEIQLAAGASAGDDCAVLALSGEVDLLATTDYVRGPKFSLYERGLLSYYDLGYYLAVANLSDVAAMGGLPLGLLPVIRYPSGFSDEDFASCMRGIVEACRLYGTTPIGGDIGTAERLILSASALGVCERGRSLRRSTAEQHDLIFVSGPIGRAGAAVLYFALVSAGQIGSIEPVYEEELLKSWRRPRARFDVARQLVESGERCAVQDVSDGLRATADELGEASQVSAHLNRSLIPVPDSVKAVAERVGVDPVALALSASVDFELAFTLPPAADALRHDLEGLGCSHVGRCGPFGPSVLIGDDAEVSPLPGVSWKHQGEDVVLTILTGLERR